jgi:hypothetical protein
MVLFASDKTSTSDVTVIGFSEKPIKALKQRRALWPSSKSIMKTSLATLLVSLSLVTSSLGQLSVSLGQVVKPIGGALQYPDLWKLCENGPPNTVGCPLHVTNFAEDFSSM